MVQLLQQVATNSNLSSSFKFRHILENSDHFLLEVKRTEMSLTDDYIWLKVTKDCEQIDIFNLSYRDSSYHIEEGYLKFDELTGIFIAKFNSKQDNYLVRDKVAGDQFTKLLNRFFY